MSATISPPDPTSANNHDVSNDSRLMDNQGASNIYSTRSLSSAGYETPHPYLEVIDDSSSAKYETLPPWSTSDQNNMACE